jgi:hypothetical protein
MDPKRSLLSPLYRLAGPVDVVIPDWLSEGGKGQGIFFPPGQPGPLHFELQTASDWEVKWNAFTLRAGNKAALSP